MYFKPIYFEHFSIITEKLQKKFGSLNDISWDNPIRYVEFDELLKDIPELDVECKNKNLRGLKGFLVHQTAGNTLLIHKDFDNNSPNLVLNWPILNCEKTFVDFYKATPDIPNSDLEYVPVKQYPNGLIALVKPNDLHKCSLVDQFEFTSPHLFNAGEFHGVKTVTKNRLLLSIRFDVPPLHLWND